MKRRTAGMEARVLVQLGPLAGREEGEPLCAIELHVEIPKDVVVRVRSRPVIAHPDAGRVARSLLKREPVQVRANVLLHLFGEVVQGSRVVKEGLLRLAFERAIGVLDKLLGGQVELQ